MRRFGLSMLAVLMLASVAFSQECSNGTCQRPVVAAVKKVVSAPVVIVQSVAAVVPAVVQAAPVRTFVRQRPVRGLVRKIFCR